VQEIVNIAFHGRKTPAKKAEFGWVIFQIADFTISENGPKTWFAIIARNG
jgi:hypothetical protein